MLLAITEHLHNSVRLLKQSYNYMQRASQGSLQITTNYKMRVTIEVDCKFGLPVRSVPSFTSRISMARRYSKWYNMYNHFREMRKENELPLSSFSNNKATYAVSLRTFYLSDAKHKRSQKLEVSEKMFIIKNFKFQTKNTSFELQLRKIAMNLED